ncbi:MAG: hypothetical protein ACUVX9_12520 [Anaerolineae bacterium]
MSEPIGRTGRAASRMADLAAASKMVREAELPARALILARRSDVVQRQPEAQGTGGQEPASTEEPSQGAEGRAPADRAPSPEAVAERVYRLLIQDLRLGRERHGC